MNPVQKEKIIKNLLYITVFLSILLLPVIVIWVSSNGVRAIITPEGINWNFFTGTPSFSTSEERIRTHGIYPQIIGSLYLVGLCTLLGSPIGVLSAVYLSEYAPENFITKVVRFFTETLAGIPSIVIGLFGMELLVYQLGLQTSLISGAASLSVMTLPWVIRASEEAIKVVPIEYREASLAMGATKWQTIRKIVIPASLPGVITGVLLGMGRAIGETAVVLLTAGGGFQRNIPSRLTSPVGNLPVYIYMVAQAATHQALRTKGHGASLVLVVMFLSMSAFALLVRNRFLKKLSG